MSSVKDKLPTGVDTNLRNTPTLRHSMIPALHEYLVDTVLGFLDCLDQIKLAPLCKASSHLGMSENDYVRKICSCFVRLAPTYSGKQLSMYRKLKFVNLGPRKIDAGEFWLR
jgi:hypothetical protein